MSNFLNTLNQLITSVLITIDKLSRPNPKYIKEKAQYEISHGRNKAIILLHLLLTFVFAADMVMVSSYVKLDIFRVFFSLFVCIFLIVSIRYHPEIFNVFINFQCICFGPLVMIYYQQAMEKVWLSTIILPIFMYLITGSPWHFVVQSMAQIIYSKTIYHNMLERSMTFRSPEEFSQALTHTLSIVLVHITILILLTHFLIQKIYHRVAIVEKKKNEIENQKNFLLGFSHELRNLINSLTGNVKLASLEELTSRGKELLLNAEVCGELLLHLVNNILDTGKVEIGELEINPAPTKTYDALERIWGVCSELIRRKNLIGKLRIQKNLPKILMIDHYRLTQIFLNLVGNAVKFTERGSIDMNVSWIPHAASVSEKCFQPYPFNETDDHDEGLFEKQSSFSCLDDTLQTLDLTSRRVDRSVLEKSKNMNRGVLKVVVSDTGCGMAKEETEKLFQKFTQVTSDASKRKLGTGLGLFITKQLCQRMLGEIRVFSKKDKGSCFIFCIPAELAPEEDEHLRDLESTKRFLASKNLKALVVDDSPFSQTVLKCFFDKLGIQVIDVAVNGLEAVKKYEYLIESGRRPDIVTMDLDMPIMDGKEAATKIRQYEASNKIEPCFLPIISGNCTESEIAECIDKFGQVKANGFLKKPASIEELLRGLGTHFVQSKGY